MELFLIIVVVVTLMLLSLPIYIAEEVNVFYLLFKTIIVYCYFKIE